MRITATLIGRGWWVLFGKLPKIYGICEEIVLKASNVLVSLTMWATSENDPEGFSACFKCIHLLSLWGIFWTVPGHLGALFLNWFNIHWISSQVIVFCGENLILVKNAHCGWGQGKIDAKGALNINIWINAVCWNYCTHKNSIFWSPPGSILHFSTNPEEIQDEQWVAGICTWCGLANNCRTADRDIGEAERKSQHTPKILGRPPTIIELDGWHSVGLK